VKPLLDRGKLNLLTVAATAAHSIVASWTRSRALIAADASVLRPGREAGKRLEIAANGFRERGLESVINRQDTVSAMNA